MKKFEEHAKVSGSEISYDTVTKIEEMESKNLKITTARKVEYTCDYLIYATGNAYRHLDVPGEDRLLGAGVSYCATCDGNFFK
jgi:thioredoxin reductase (NADPH)